VNEEALTRWGLSRQKQRGVCFEGQNEPRMVDTLAEIRIALFLNKNTKKLHLGCGM